MDSLQRRVVEVVEAEVEAEEEVGLQYQCYQPANMTTNYNACIVD